MFEYDPPPLQVRIDQDTRRMLDELVSSFKDTELGRRVTISDVVRAAIRKFHEQETAQ